MLIVSLITVLLSLRSYSCHLHHPEVSTSSGKIVGHYLVSGGGCKYEAYEGIPYALPPLGSRRFCAPEPAQPWRHKLVANKFPAQCIGHGRRIVGPDGYVTGVEDCLYLNVYVPIRKRRGLLPVIFWIYGGAFMESTLSGDEHLNLIDHDIIFVSVNYRLGALGFLSTEDGIVSGNMGLKDQSLALQWVNKNIKNFGGDPNRITLFGASAGGSSVHYHYLSPMSAGLFRGGIGMSGTAYDSWSQVENSREKTIRLANSLNCTMKDMAEIIQCLRTKPALDIAKAQTPFMPWRLNEFTPFGPVVENVERGAFINRSPVEIIESGDVYDAPWVTSVVSEEGVYPLGEFLTNDTALKEVNDEWETIAPLMLNYYYTVPKDKHASVAAKIRKHYFGDEPINRKTRLNLTHVAGDRNFCYDAQKAAKAQAKVNKNPVWFYFYSYRASHSISEIAFNVTENLGSGHVDDLMYALGVPEVHVTETKDDFTIHKDLLNFIISFVYNGVPNLGSNWKAVEPEAPYLNYLHVLGPKKYQMEKSDNFAQKKFWDTVEEFNENKINRQ